jgi:hypothetical protein
MPVRVNIVGGRANKSVQYPDDSNTEAVEKKLLGGFGPGVLELNGFGVLSEFLPPGENEYHLTIQQGQLFSLSLLLNRFLVFLDEL